MDDIDAMEAGPELDAMVAVEVMGLPETTLEQNPPCPKCGGEMRFCGRRAWCLGACHEWMFSPYKEYSTDIAAAWEVVEKVREDIGCHFFMGHTWHAGLFATFCGNKVAALDYGQSDQKGHARADTAPLAICRAALKAVRAHSPNTA